MSERTVRRLLQTRAGGYSLSVAGRILLMEDGARVADMVSEYPDEAVRILRMPRTGSFTEHFYRIPAAC
jgi:hypothetical protein